MDESYSGWEEVMFCCENDIESLDRINAGKLLISWAIAAF